LTREGKLTIHMVMDILVHNVIIVEFEHSFTYNHDDFTYFEVQQPLAVLG
jgi:hypothetical protein